MVLIHFLPKITYATFALFSSAKTSHMTTPNFSWAGKFIHNLGLEEE